MIWIILFTALDDFGIRELNEVVRTGSPPHTAQIHQFETVKRKVADEAVHGALRIAGLVSLQTRKGVPTFLLFLFLIINNDNHQAGVLTSNGYLVRG